MTPEMTDKEKGELAEVAFMYECTQRGITVLEPHGDSAPYDVAVDTGSVIHKIQIKSAHTLSEYHGFKGYRVGTTWGIGAVKRYLPGMFDFMAATVIPEKAWYIIPAYEAIARNGIWLYAGLEHKGRTRYFEQYLGAWERLIGG